MCSDGQTDDSSKAGGAGTSGTVLIVEDHEDTAEVTERVLRLAGFCVRRAAGCAEARSLASKVDFDLLLCDLGLADGDGCDLLRELRGQYGIDGIAYSGYGMPQDLTRSADAGFLAHLVKPVSIDRLVAAVRGGIARRQDQPPPTNAPST